MEALPATSVAEMMGSRGPVLGALPSRAAALPRAEPRRAPSLAALLGSVPRAGVVAALLAAASAWRGKRYSRCALVAATSSGHRRGLRRRTSAVAASAAAAASTEAPPRPPREEPTPFPPDRLFPWQVEDVLMLLCEEKVEQDALIEALAELQDLHEYDRQWIQWPRRLVETEESRYKKGCCQLLKGILHCIEKAPPGVRRAAIDLFYSLVIGGCRLTRVPTTLLVDAGAVEIISKVAAETSDQTTFAVLHEIAAFVPSEMLTILIEEGALEAALNTIQEDSHPMEQLMALELVTSLAKRSPAKTAEAGAYEAVKAIDNEALVPKRNKIMNLLRPLIENPGEPALTNIRIGGLKY